MICKHCNTDFATTEDYVAHLESITSPPPQAPEGTAQLDGLADALRRNRRDPNTRATPSDFGIL